MISFVIDALLGIISHVSILNVLYLVPRYYLPIITLFVVFDIVHDM